MTTVCNVCSLYFMYVMQAACVLQLSHIANATTTMATTATNGFTNTVTITITTTITSTLLLLLLI